MVTGGAGFLGKRLQEALCTAGATPDKWTVTVNGVAQQVPSDATGVVFDGLGGNDTVVLTGTGKMFCAGGGIWPRSLT